MKLWPEFLRRKQKQRQYGEIESPEDTRLWHIPTPDEQRERQKREAARLQRRVTETNRKIKREDIIKVLNRKNYVDHFEDETIPDKAIVLKMPERKMKTFFIPLPVDLDGLKRRAIDLFGLQDEVDVFSRLEFELFAFGVIPTSASLPLLKDREVVYINLLPPRPPTPFTITLAPPREENSLVAEVRRAETGGPYEVVYSQQTASNTANGEVRYSPSKKGRFKEHFSEAGSRPQSENVALSPQSPAQSGSVGRRKSATKAWYKDSADESLASGQQSRVDPFDET